MAKSIATTDTPTVSAGEAENARPWLPGLLLVALTALVFHRVVGFEFLTWDDDQHVVTNEYYDPITLRSLLHFWGYSYIYMYIPVSYTFFGLEAALSLWFPSGNPADKFNPAIFHLGNLLIHLASTFLAFRLFVRMVRHVPAAFLGAMLFAVHPLQVESVAWIGETRGTLAALFSLLALRSYFNFAGLDPVHGIFAERRYDASPRRRSDYALATLYFALALLSKPSAASFPLIVAAVDMLLLHRPWRDTLRWTALWFVMAAGITGLTKYYQRTDMIYVLSVPPLVERPFVAGDAYAFYLAKLAWPADLAFDHGRTPHYVKETSTYRIAWLLPLAVGAALAAARRRRIWLGCYAIFAAAILPVSGLVPFLYQSISTVADRYMYVPLFGFGLMAAAWIATRRNPAPVVAGVAVVLGLLAHRSYEQTRHWRSDATVFGHGLQVTPQSFMAHLHLANRYKKEQRYELAIDHYRKMLTIREDYFTTHYQIGYCLHELKRYDEAVRAYDDALAIDPHYEEAYCAKGYSLTELGRHDDALMCFRLAMAKNLLWIEPRMCIAETQARQGKLADAEKTFREIIAKNEADADVFVRYGRMLARADRLSEAVAQFAKAVELNPRHHAARYESAATLFRQGKFVPAIAEAEEAVRLKPNDFGSLQVLGQAQVAAGRAAAAVAPLRHALTLVPPASPQAAVVRKLLAEVETN